MRRSFADIVQYPYLAKPNTIHSLLLLGDCWEHIFKYLTPSDYVNLRCVSRGFNIVIQPKRKLLYWSVKVLDFLRQCDSEMYKLCQYNLRKISRVKQLEELFKYPNLIEIKFHKQFPTNRNKQKRELRCGFIPKIVKIIHFGGFNHLIHQQAIPRNIVELYFGDCFNQCLDPLIFSELDNLKIIVLGTSFNNNNKPLDPKTFSKSLEILEINSNYFNQEISTLLTNLPNLTTLRLGNGYTQHILKLPYNIKYLTVGENYNCDLMSCIINSAIVYLKVGKRYKHYIDPKQITRKINIDLDIESYKEVLFTKWKSDLL